MKIGFENFCNDFAFDYDIITEFEVREIYKGDVYITTNDWDLVRVIKKAKIQNLQLGSDYGIISYYVILLKRIVKNSIKTISTNFKVMVKILANRTLKEKRNKLRIRNSL